LKGLQPGQPVIVESARGQFMGHGYANPQSLISVRLLSRDQNKPFNADRLRQRLTHAHQLREKLFTDQCYRLVHGEGDFLPGLTVDRYGDVLVIEVTTAGMERYVDTLIEQLVDLTGAKHLLLKNDSPLRSLEGLALTTQWVKGEAQSALNLVENDLAFTIPLDGAQKTGWFYDHRESRRQLRRFCRGARVLDVYSYVGGFAINAAVGGATDVLAVDASQRVVDSIATQVAVHGMASVVRARCGDAVDVLRELQEANEQFDVIILDPPAFVKRRKDLDAGLQHYGVNHKHALRLLKPGGILFSASCSQLVEAAALKKIARQAIPRHAVGLQILGPLAQAADHPINCAMQETRYLDGFIARLVGHQ